MPGKVILKGILEGAEAQVPQTWNVGDVILDLYEVTGILGEGGMGKVYRVHHRGWKVDLAVKSPKPEVFARADGKESFIREAETWVNLGLHPNVVSCYYVRTLGGIPRIFAEYVEGGSLSDWVRDRRLTTLDKMLDVAIQFAWGLHYAHEQGVVHQDVKPANVMMTPDGIAKVTDFGLARARAAAGEVSVAGSGQSILVSSGGLTPAYCSPEQAAGQSLSRKTDIWSWTVSILEMFVGEVTWMAGQAAAEALAGYQESGPTDASLCVMPRALAELLQRCLQRDPADRPATMAAIAATLQQIYQQATGRSYPRPAPNAAELRADGLNNRALSLLDLGKGAQAEAAWQAALQADVHHAEATYNLGLWRWRTAQQTDETLVQQVQAVAATQAQAWRPRYLLGLVHLERGDGRAAEAALKEVAQLAPADQELQQALARLEDTPTAGFVRAFEGHTDSVFAVAVTPDGRCAVSGSADDTLLLWELANGSCLRTFEGHTSRVTAVAVTPDGRCAVSGSWDNTLRLWELASGRCLHTFEGHTSSVYAVAVTPDGRYVVSGSSKDRLRLWELASGRCLRTFEGQTDWVDSIAITPDGRCAVSGGSKTLRLWELASGRCLRTFEGQTDWVDSIAITPDGRYAVSGGSKTLRLWELAGGRCLRTFEGHTDSVSAVVATSDGRCAVSGSRDKTLRLWELASGCCLRTFRGNKGCVYAVAITPDGRYAVSGSDDKKLELWKLKGVGERKGDWAFSHPGSSVRAEQDTRVAQEEMVTARLALAEGRPADAGAALRRALSLPGYERDSSLLAVWHEAGRRAGRPVGLRVGRCLRIFGGHPGVVAVTPDGHCFVSNSRHDTLRLWELASGNCLRTLEGSVDDVYAVAVTPDGRYALSGSHNCLTVSELATGRCLRTFSGHMGDVLAIAVSPDGRYAVSGSGDKSLQLWELASGRCLRIFEGHRRGVVSIAVTPDGRCAVSGSLDETLRLWELASGRCLRTFEGHTREVRRVAVTPDGRHAVSGSDDKKLGLWELASGHCVRTFERHTKRVTAVAVTPDGRYAVSGSEDQTLRLWELASGRCLQTFSAVSPVAATPDGRYVVSGSLDETLRLWELNWEYEFPEPADWDEDVRPYLEIFLTLHTPYDRDGISRVGPPTWTEDDFQRLLVELGTRGYGWLRSEGVRRELEKMAREWQGPPPLVGA